MNKLNDVSTLNRWPNGRWTTPPRAALRAMRASANSLSHTDQERTSTMIQAPELEPSTSCSYWRGDQLFWLLPLLLGFCLAALPAHAATRIWTGGHASSANWNLRDNWGGVAVPANGDTVVFPSGAPRLVNTNNIAGLRLHEIQFLGLGGGFNVRGASLAVSNGITVAADALNTLSVTSVTLHGSQALSVASGGQLTVNSDLVLSNANLTLAGAGDFSLRGGISGSGDVIKNGSGLATYFSEKDNTYRGTTFVNAGTLALNQRETVSIVPLTVESRIAVPGNLVVGDGTNAVIVRLNFDDQIANTATVTVLENAELNFFDQRDAFTDLVMRGGNVTMNGGLLVLNGDITSQATANASSVGGQILLNNSATLDVADGPAAVDLEIVANIGSNGGHGLTKAGTGTLRLRGTNTYLGPTLVRAGTIRLGSDTALGAPNGNTTIAAGAELFIEPPVETLREPLTIAGAGIGGASGAIRIGSGATIATNIVLSAPATINTIGGGNLTIEGVISGTGPLTKVGPGTLVLAGNSANTFTGELIATDGELLLSKLSGSAVQGDLIIGTTNTTAIARHTRSANLGSAVTVNPGSLYDLDGVNESIDNLTLIGGGDVQTGSGQLTVDSTITALRGPVPTIQASSISGRLRLGSVGTAYVTVHPDTGVELPYVHLVISAPVSGSVPIIKNGPGNVTLSSSNSFIGSFTVADGRLNISDSHALGSPSGDTFVEGDSTIALNSIINVEGERLFLNSTRTNDPAILGFSGALVNLASNTWAGQIFLAKNATVNVTTNSVLKVSGVINGLAGLTKVGTGTLIYSGTASNTYIGTTRVNEGKLLLERSGLGSISIPGALIVGDGLGGVEADMVEVGENAAQIDNHAAVTLASSGLLRLRHREEIGSLSGFGRVFVEGDQFIVTDSGGSTTYGGAISGPGDLVKQGPGTLILTGVNSHTGDTLVYGGTLVINGTQPSSDVYVAPSATLSGIGFIGALSIDGTLIPGNPLGRLAAESVNFLPGSTMIERIDGPPQSGAFTPYGNNWFQSQGALDVTGAALDVTLGFPPSAGQQFYIGTKLGAALPSGTFVGKPEGMILMLNQIPFRLSYQGGSGNDIILTVGELPLHLGSARVDAGNGNGRIEPDECNDLFVVIENPTAAGVNVLNAYLQSLDNRIVVTQAESEYGSVPASGSRTNRTAFQIRSASNYSCGENAEFHLVLETVGHGRFAIPITLPTGTPGAYQEFASAAGPAIIPDAGALNSQLPVTSSYKVGKVRVSLHATHPSAGQLRLKLISPQGVEVLLAEGEGGAGNNYGQSCERRTTFVDSAFVSIATADAPFSGTFAPEGNLSGFVGLDSLGVWTLLAEDTVAGGLGALQCWTLELAPAECAPAGGGCDSCFATVNGVLDVGRTMPERLLGGYPTGCGDAPHCPGTTSIWHDPYRYTTHTFTNTGPDACVTVMLTVPCAEPNRGLTGSAYLGDFDPANLCANLLGHSGDDVEQGSGGFSFRVPAGERFTVVANEQNIYEAFQGCDTYALQLYGLPCPQEQPRLHIANDAGPDKVRLHWSTAYPGFELQGRPSLDGLVIGGFTNVNAAPVVIDGHYSVTNKHDAKGNGFFRLRKP